MESSGGHAKESRKPIARGMPVSPVSLAAATASALLPFRADGRDALLALAASRAPSDLGVDLANPGVSGARKRWRLFEILSRRPRESGDP